MLAAMNFKTAKPWQIITGAALAVFVPLILIAAMEGPLIEDVQGWQVFLGPYYGALFGLFAILAGALYNAKLNRDHHDWVLEKEIRALAAAYAAELYACSRDLGLVSVQMREVFAGKVTEAAVRKRLATMTTLRVINATADRVGLLGPVLSERVIRAAAKFERVCRLVENSTFNKEGLFVVDTTRGRMVIAADELALRSHTTNWENHPPSGEASEASADG